MQVGWVICYLTVKTVIEMHCLRHKTVVNTVALARKNYSTRVFMKTLVGALKL